MARIIPLVYCHVIVVLCIFSEIMSMLIHTCHTVSGTAWHCLAESVVTASLAVRLQALQALAVSH